MKLRHTFIHATALALAVAAVPVLAQQTETTETTTTTMSRAPSTLPSERARARARAHRSQIRHGACSTISTICRYKLDLVNRDRLLDCFYMIFFTIHLDNYDRVCATHL